MQDLQQLNIRWYRIPCLSTGHTNIISSTTNEGSATASSTHTHSAPPTSPTLLKDKNLVEEFEISCTTGLLFVSTIFSRHHTVWMFKYVKQSTHLNWAAEFCLFVFILFYCLRFFANVLIWSTRAGKYLPIYYTHIQQCSYSSMLCLKLLLWVLIAIATPSIGTKNSNGARGSPCLYPQCIL